VKEKGLCEICSPKQWKTISAKMLTETGYSVYGANGVIGYYTNYNHEQPTILITCRGATCGTLNICEPFSYVNGNAMALDNLSEEINIKYLYYYLLFRGLSDVITGSAQPQIVRQSLAKVKVIYPSLDKQHKTVAVIDKVSDLIAKRNRQISKLDELVKSRFIEMFVKNESATEWPYHTISEVSKDMRTGPFGSALHHDEFVDSGVFVLGIDNAVENRFSYNRMRYITENKYQQLKRYTVYPGDVIITIMGTVGRSAVIPDDIPQAINTKHLACITPDTEKANPYFLSCVFQIHPAVHSQLQKQCKGAIMDGLNLTIIKGLSLLIPPINLQNQFVAFYEQTDKSKLAIQKSLKKLEILKKALMQKYFG
jgi:type I restriction enzyme S subunit